MRCTAILMGLLLTSLVQAQQQQSAVTRIVGNVELNGNADQTTAVATGNGSRASNRIGVVQGSHQGDTRVAVQAARVTTIANGRNKRACTQIGGIVSHDCE